MERFLSLLPTLDRLTEVALMFSVKHPNCSDYLRKRRNLILLFSKAFCTKRVPKIHRTDVQTGWLFPIIFISM